jgi:hypothetical protein
VAQQALRSLNHLPLAMVLQTCSKASWLAALLKVVPVLLRRRKSSKVSLVCLGTCRPQVRLASTRLQLLLTTPSLMADSLKDLASMATVLSRRNRRLHQAQVSRTLVLVAAALMVSRPLNRANRIRIPAHLV